LRLHKAAAAVLISDYGYGMATPELARKISTAVNQRIPITLDARRGLLRYPPLTAATPNEPELEELFSSRIGTDTRKLEECGKDVLRRMGLEALLVTRGKDGMVLFEPDVKPQYIPIYGTDEIADVTGAGDTVIAVFTLALAAGASFLEAARLANYAGGIVVMKRGTATVTPDELRASIESR
jgi:rfaE bifunctional protein kinase chain/domain